ncbi:glutaredoxin-C8-like [Hordeum vulgare subsp. vulgare]|uniref:glutaredoxin-C8-like n=1 Tax=Hordeum vulgare subsp. vulgare TaxID=112509 RepID=UPI001D1A4028|nr:glutaredoxin-C8-like [Hordeum vulgare subsp. vulgare]
METLGQLMEALALSEGWTRRPVAARHGCTARERTHVFGGQYCRRAKVMFKELELKKDPYVVELDQREDGGEIQNALSDMVGSRTVPQVFIRGNHLGGSDDTADAYGSGEMAKLLNISVKDDL